MREPIREFKLQPDDYTTAVKLIGWSWVGLGWRRLAHGRQRRFVVRAGDEPGVLGVKHAEVMERLYVIDAVMGMAHVSWGVSK